MAADLSRFKPGATIETWTLSPSICPTKDFAIITMKPEHKTAQGVWLTAEYPGRTIVQIAVSVKRAEKGPRGDIELRGSWNINGYEIVASDKLAASQDDRTLRISPPAPPVGNLGVGLFLTNNTGIAQDFALSALDITPAPQH